jgi:hypothetical protein
MTEIANARDGACDRIPLLIDGEVEITERLQPTLERIAVALERIADLLGRGEDDGR